MKTKIFTILAILGVFATGATSIIATRKAVKKIDEVEKRDGTKLTQKQATKLVANYYVPPAISIVVSTASIIAAESINAKTIASATAAAALLKKSYDKYGTAVKNVFGEEGNNLVKKEMELNPTKRPPEKEELYWIGFGYDDYFKAKPSDLERAEYIINRKLRSGQTANVSDFFEAVGIEPNCISSTWGWGYFEMMDVMQDGWLSINTEQIRYDNDDLVNAIDFDCMPSEDYEITHKLYVESPPWEDKVRPV